MMITDKGVVMKFNVFFEKNKGAHWVLSDGSFSFKSQPFETRPKAIKDLEQFVTLMDSPKFIEPGEEVSSENASKSPEVLVTFKQQDNLWSWYAWISKIGNLSKVVDSPFSQFETLELARTSAKYTCNNIAAAPILDQADVVIPNMHFSESFSDEHGIGDAHPSRKWLK